MNPCAAAEYSCDHETLTHEASSARGCVALSPLYCKRNIAKTSELSAGALPRRVLERNMSPNTTSPTTTEEQKRSMSAVEEAKLGNQRMKRTGTHCGPAICGRLVVKQLSISIRAVSLVTVNQYQAQNWLLCAVRQSRSPFQVILVNCAPQVKLRPLSLPAVLKSLSRCAYKGV